MKENVETISRKNLVSLRLTCSWYCAQEAYSSVLCPVLSYPSFFFSSLLKQHIYICIKYIYIL